MACEFLRSCHIYRLPRHHFCDIFQQIHHGDGASQDMRLRDARNHCPVGVPLRLEVLSRTILHNCTHDPSRRGHPVQQLLQAPLWCDLGRNSHVHHECLLCPTHLAYQSLANPRSDQEEAQLRAKGSNSKVGQQAHGKPAVQHGKKVRRNTLNNVVHLSLLFVDSSGSIFLHHWAHLVLLG